MFLSGCKIHPSGHQKIKKETSIQILYGCVKRGEQQYGFPKLKLPDTKVKGIIKEGSKMSGREEEIVTLVTMCGEIVGRVASETATTVMLKSPLLFVPSGNDNEGGGFAPGISMTGAQNMPRGEFNKSCILTVIPAHPQVADGWLKATGSIIV